MTRDMLIRVLDLLVSISQETNETIRRINDLGIDKAVALGIMKMSLVQHIMRIWPEGQGQLINDAEALAKLINEVDCNYSRRN